MTDGSGAVQAHYEYDLYGQPTKTNGALNADFQYAGYYEHGPSGLNLTVYRAYSSTLGRWINRDPIEEKGGVDLYDYVGNNPAGRIDPDGTCDCLSALDDCLQDCNRVLQNQLAGGLPVQAAGAYARL